MWHHYCMAVTVFLDTEFTSLLDPHLWSIGLVTLDSRELYVELDPGSPTGKSRLAMTPWDVREGVLDKFGLFPDSVCESEAAIGRRVGAWLLELAESDSAGRIELLYDYSVDFELLVGALEESQLWSRVQAVASGRNIADETSGIDPELASETAFGALRQRTPPLYRHHALADALALRAAWIALDERA